MKQVYVECFPDEELVKALGFTRKCVKHHSGKSRVFHSLKEAHDVLALVDEDPGRGKCSYEKTLSLIEEKNDVILYHDKSKNKIFVLRIKLEDWILKACREIGVNSESFNLPANPKHLHDEINHKLSNFKKLIVELIDKKSPALLQLKDWMK